jgi:hypothetical protein
LNGRGGKRQLWRNNSNVYPAQLFHDFAGKNVGIGEVVGFFEAFHLGIKPRAVSSIKTV